MTIPNINFSVRDILSRAWELLKNNFFQLFLIWLVWLALGIPVAIVDMAMQEMMLNDAVWFILYIIYKVFVAIFISIPLALGNYKILLNIVDGKEAQLATLFSQYKPSLIIHTIFGYIAITIPILIGYLFFIIPGIYLTLRLQFFHLVLIEQEKPDFSEAIKESWNRTEDHSLKLFLLGLMSFGVTLLGWLACCIGVIPAIMVAYLMSVIAFRLLGGKGAGGANPMIDRDATSEYSEVVK